MGLITYIGVGGQRTMCAHDDLPVRVGWQTLRGARGGGVLWERRVSRSLCRVWEGQVDAHMARLKTSVGDLVVFSKFHQVWET